MADEALAQWTSEAPGVNKMTRVISANNVKYYLRSTMQQERTSNLALLALEQDVVEQLDKMDSIIKQFDSCKVTRLSTA